MFSAKRDDVEHIRASGFFDSEWYLEQYSDVKPLGLDPIDHYLWVGARMGRNPSPRFDTASYFETHKDVANAGINPLLHFLRARRKEGGATPEALNGAARVEIRQEFRQTTVAASRETILCATNGASAPDLFSLRAAPLAARRAIVAHLTDDESVRRLGAMLSVVAPDYELIVTQPARLHVDSAERLEAKCAKRAVVVYPDRMDAAQALLHLVNAGPLCDHESVCWIDASHEDVGCEAGAKLSAFWLGGATRKIGLYCTAFGAIPSDQMADLLAALGSYLARVGRKLPPILGHGPTGGVTVVAPLLLHQLRAYRIQPKELAGRLDPAHALAAILSIVCEEAGLERSTFAYAGRPTLLADASERKIKAIAFYLPQFHPIPENDLWWGRGFTEWTNVTRARPVFRSHFQPQIPADLGFYDLRSPDTQLAQAELAYHYNVYGFCYYYYWFDGKKLLNRPIEQMLESGKPNLPFCLCWANENWSRNWDGQNRHVLLEQSYSKESNRTLIREFIRLMKDSRYIRHNGKPVLVVYRIRVIPKWLETAAMWREECRCAGIGEIHLCAVRFGLESLDGNPSEFGVDSFVLFPPHESEKVDAKHEVQDLVKDYAGTILSYDAVVDGDIARFEDGYPWPVHRGAMLGWDNTARRPRDSRIFLGSTPARFHRWLKEIVAHEERHNPNKESLLFINAWNEWAEGTTLEPSTRFGRGYLEAVRTALDGLAPEVAPPSPLPAPKAKRAVPLIQWREGARQKLPGTPTVLVCSHVVSHELFGGERSFIDVLDALGQIELNVIVALPSAAHGFYTKMMQKRSIGVAIIPYRQWRNNRAAEEEIVRAFADLIEERGVDIVYANTIVLLEPLVAAKRTKRLSVVHARELIDRDEGLVDQIGLPPDRIIEAVSERADFIVANSKSTAALFHREDATFSAPNVVDPHSLDIDNIIGATITFAIVSSNLPKKGVSDFVEVARLCETLAPNARFEVIGPENAYVEQWKKEKLPANLSFAGYAESPRAAMLRTNVVLSLSHFAESFGRTVAEAQAGRRPVIAYEYGAVTELIEDGVTGFLVPYRDIAAAAAAVARLCAEPALIARMGEVGRARIVRTNAPTTLRDNLRRAFERMLGHNIPMRAAAAGRATIIVPVFNAHDETRACLASLERSLDFSDVRVLIINDASTDPRIGGLLEGYAARDGFDLIVNEKNIGYTGVINIGIRWAGEDDVVLLNSDTIVTRGFLDGLRRAAYHHFRIGTATAMGDNAGAFSFPNINEANPKPEAVSHGEHAAAILARTAACAPVEVPTGSGFCMYIRRALFDAIGLFDEETFPRGYGEENDFCMRALHAGWRSVISPYAYVFHKRSASFGEEKALLIKGAVDKVTKRYPDYAPKVKSAFASAEMAVLREAAEGINAKE